MSQPICLVNTQIVEVIEGEKNPVKQAAGQPKSYRCFTLYDTETTLENNNNLYNLHAERLLKHSLQPTYVIIPLS